MLAAAGPALAVTGKVLSKVPDGKEGRVANRKAGTLSVIDTASRKQVAEIAVGKGP